MSALFGSLDDEKRRIDGDMELRLQRQADLVKFGIHFNPLEARGEGGKWVSAGSKEHAAALRDLADTSDAHGAGVGHQLRQAADSIDHGQHAEAGRAISSARASLTARDEMPGRDSASQDDLNKILVRVREHQAAMTGQSYGKARPGHVPVEPVFPGE